MDKARLALELEHYIRDYTPEGWKKSIETVMFVPWVSVVDINRILNNDIPSKFVFKGSIVWITNERIEDIADKAKTHWNAISSLL